MGNKRNLRQGGPVKIMSTAIEDKTYVLRFDINDVSLSKEETTTSLDVALKDKKSNWETVEDVSLYIEEQQLKEIYTEFAKDDIELAEVGIQEYSERLTNIDNEK